MFCLTAEIFKEVFEYWRDLGVLCRGYKGCRELCRLFWFAFTNNHKEQKETGHLEVLCKVLDLNYVLTME